MKRIGVWLGCGIIVLAVIYFVSSTMMFNNVKDNVMEQNLYIEQIHQINRIGTWGEWFSEYVLIVERNGQQFRIWTNGDGNITDQEALAAK